MLTESLSSADDDDDDVSVTGNSTLTFSPCLQCNQHNIISTKLIQEGLAVASIARDVQDVGLAELKHRSSCN